MSRIMIYYWDGSVLYRLTPVNYEQVGLITILSEVNAEVAIPHLPLALGDALNGPRPWSLSLPVERLALTAVA